MTLFVVSAGYQIGIGHVRRCVQIAIGLQEIGIKTLFFLPYEQNSFEFIKKANIPYQLQTPEIEIEQILTKFKGIEVVVLDLLNANRFYTKRIKEISSVVRIVGLDYFDMYDNLINLIINLYNHNTELKRPITKTVKYCDGPSWGIIRNEFLEYLPIAKSYSIRLKRILVTFGGADPKNHTLSIISLLSELTISLDVEVTIIIGPNFYHETQVRELLGEKMTSAKVYKNPENIASLMFNTDICICGSGTTILELATIGTPAIVIPQSKEELDFASVFENSGFAVIAGTPECVDLHKVENYILHLYQQPSKIRAIGELGRNLCDGKGTKKIINEIKHLMKS